MKQQPRHSHRRQATSRTRLVRALVVVAVLAVAAIAVTGFSSASFIASSFGSASVSSAADWTPPTVSMQSPGSSVRGTAVALSASASDAESGIESVAIQYQAVEGAGWTTVCNDTTAPYGCSWGTTSVADGAYDLRAVATDKAGYTTISAPVRTVVANSVTVVLSDPGEVLKGTVTLDSTVYSALLATSTTVQYSPAGQNKWTTACTSLVATSCSWSTTSVPSGTYDLRTVALVGFTNYTSNVITDVVVDNTAPTVTMTDPGTPLSGTRTFGATANDADSGVAQVVVQYASSGSSTFRTLCTITATPFTCRADTTQLANGTYTFRAVATDVAGNTATSTTVTNRVVDNTVASVSVEDPGTYLNGTVTLNASANAGAGITSVRIQRAPTGTTTWSDVCTDTTAPYSCSWDTRTVTDGGYDLRAILVDASGRTTTSSTVSNRLVDNKVVRGVDVQAANGGGSVGRLDSGDKLTFTYSEQVKPSTLLAGWAGDSRAVTLRLRDGNLVGAGAKGDTVDVLSGSTAVNLGSVNLGGDYVKSNKTVTFAATLTTSTTTVSGTTRTVVTVQLGSVTGSGLKTVSGNATMTWTPSAAATDLSGNVCSVAPVTESGTADRDF